MKTKLIVKARQFLLENIPAFLSYIAAHLIIKC